MVRVNVTISRYFSTSSTRCACELLAALQELRILQHDFRTSADERYERSRREEQRVTDK